MGETSTSMPWWVYILRGSDDSLYTGITTDLDRRLRQHNGELSGGAKAIRGKRPLKRVWEYPCSSRSDASRLEIRIKRMSKSQKERWINDSATQAEQ